MSNLVKLGTVLKIMHGYAFKSVNYLPESQYRLVTLGNFSEGDNCFKYNDSKATYYGADFPSSFILSEGDLIMPLTEQTMGLFGNSAFIPKESRFTFVLNQRVGKVICDETIVDVKYMHYLLATELVKKQLEARASGTKQRNISPEDVYDVEVFLPDLSTQKKVGKFLYDLEQKQQNNQSINLDLTALVKLVYDYWFVQYEFPDENGNPYKSSSGKMIWNEELKQEIPDNWAVDSIGSLITEREKSSVQVGEAAEHYGKIPFFTSGDEIIMYNKAFTSGKNCFLNTGGNADVKYYIGDAAYSTDTWCITAGDYSSYLYEYMDSIKKYIDISFFAGSGLKHLQKDAFKSHKLVIPPKTLIQIFNKTADKCFAKISEIKLENQSLSELRDFLLPMLMNGQVKVG